MDQEKASHVNAVTLCFRDSDKERQVTTQYINCKYNIQYLTITIPQYQEDPDIGFPASLSCSLLVTLLLGGLQVNTGL